MSLLELFKMKLNLLKQINLFITKEKKLKKKYYIILEYSIISLILNIVIILDIYSDTNKY